MGGLISLHAVLKGYLKPKALVMASPLLRLPQQPVPGNIAKPLSNILSKLKLDSVSTGAGSHTQNTPFEVNQLTHNYDRYQEMSRSLYPIPGATFGWANETFKALDEVFSEELLSNLEIPVLLMHGSNESVVDPSGFRDWITTAQKYSKAEIEYRVISGARHELYSEIDAYFDPAVSFTKNHFKKFLEDT